MIKIPLEFRFPSNLTQNPEQSIYIHYATFGLCGGGFFFLCVFFLYCIFILGCIDCS